MEQQIKYIYTKDQIESLVFLCAEYVNAVITEGIEDKDCKINILQNVHQYLETLVQENLEKKIDAKETIAENANSIDSRAQVFGVDPINEVLVLHFELMYVRFLFNELVISDEKFKEVINESIFEKARAFAAEQMKLRFPAVQQNAPVPPAQDPDPTNEEVKELNESETPK